MQTQRTITTPYGDFMVDVDYSIQDWGIGAYEFWGMHGTHQDLGVEVDDIQSSDERVNKYIDDNFEKLAEQIALELEAEGEIDNYIGSQEDTDGDAWEGGFADNH